MQLEWQKCQGDAWCPLMTVNLSHIHFNNMEGVYIIWQGDGPVVRVGQGSIKDRLVDHREDRVITAYKNLYVTWASVLAQNRDGVERYLADTLGPVVGDAFPDTIPITVNLPWSRRA